MQVLLEDVIDVALADGFPLGRKNEPRNYVLLEELNTFPRTSYLARLTNPNPKVSG